MNAAVRLREIVLLFASTLTIIGTTVIAASLPQMAVHFAGEPQAAYWVRISLTLPALAAGIAALGTGWVVAKVGRKAVFIAALALYGCAGAAGYVLNSLETLLASRFMLGLSIAAIMTCATTLIADYARRDGLGGALGRQSLFMAIGNILFVFLGGVLASINWRLPFLIYLVAFAILSGVILLVRDLPVSREAGSSTRAPTHVVAPICGLGAVNMVAYFMVPVYLPFHLGNLTGANSFHIGALLSLVGLSWGGASLAYQYAARRLRYVGVVALGFCLHGAGLIILGLASGYIQACIGLVVIGWGLGMNVPNFNAWMMSRVPLQSRGHAFGLLARKIHFGSRM